MEEENKNVDVNEKKNIDDEIIDDEKKDKKKHKYIEKLQKENDELKKEVETWKDKAYRTAADCDNLRKSYEKDHANMLKYRAMGFVEKLLPALDSFHLSLSVKSDDASLQNYVKGFEMIYRQILSAFEQEGVVQIAPKIGDNFNVDTMQAIDVQEADGEENKVLQVYSNGFMLKDRLVRPAMVVVSKKADQKDDKKENQEGKLVS